MLAGVVGGLAEYFGMDPTPARVLYALVSAVSAAFPGIAVCLILWIVMPEAGQGDGTVSLSRVDHVPAAWARLFHAGFGRPARLQGRASAS
jgi:phage shock protein C